jgi:simple sugar transport system permease protein
MKAPYKITIEKRMEEIPKWMPTAISLGAVLVAFIISGVILALIGSNPFRTYTYFFNAAFGSWGAFSDILVKATPLIMIGTGYCLAFKMNIISIGGEGQFYMGAFFASLVILVPLVPADSPKFLVLSLMALMGLLGGGLYGLIPGVLKAYFGVNEIITTLMLNYVAVNWNNYWIFGKYSDAGFQMTPTFDKVAWLPRLADLAKQFPFFSGITLHLGVVFGLIAAVLIWVILKSSRWGYEITLIGDNPRAAEYAGVNIKRNILLVMLISGALAGLAGMSEVTGVVHRLQEKISVNYGFSGVIVAWLAKLNPLAVIPIAILFGGLIVAGREIQPSGLSFLIQGLTLFLVISSNILLRYHVRITRRREETA